jgi:uncharacterized delta-60 repeat protein
MLRAAHRRTSKRALRGARWFGVLVALAATTAVCMSRPGPAPGATASTVVGVTIPSATNLSASGCASGVPGRTDFGTVLPTSKVVTTLDCSVVFGSSNDTAKLRIAQHDGSGVAMAGLPGATLTAGFGTAGKVHYNDALAPFGMAVVVQPDGKLVVAAKVNGVSGGDFGVYRFNADGTIDGSFGTGGRVTTSFTNNSDEAYDLALQPDGKIVVVGRVNGIAGNFGDYGIARYSSAGVLDPTFGTGGLVQAGFSGAQDDMYTVALQPDGKILGGGWCNCGATSGYVTRYTSAGVLDTTWGTAGVVGMPGRVERIALQLDGTLYAAGNDGPGTSMVLARLTSAGAFDGSFGTSGIASAAQPPGYTGPTPTSIAVQADGKVVLGGNVSDTVGRWALVRYSSSGAVDTSFGSSGWAVLPYGISHAGIRYVTPEPNGQLTVGGSVRLGSFDYAVSRLNANGTADTTLDPSGFAGFDVTGDDQPQDAVKVADNSLVQVGGNNSGGITMVKHAAPTIADYVSTTTDWTAGSGMFGACLVDVTGTGATASWVKDATCAATDGTYWNAVPSTPTTIAQSLTSTTTNATALLRFGLRPSATQKPGYYGATIDFDVVAPAV